MTEFLDVSMRFPAIVFSVALVVVLAFWLLVLLGVTEADGFGTDTGLAAAGLGGVPVTVTASLMTVCGWLTSLGGSVLLRRAGFQGPGRTVADVALLLLSLLVAWWVTRLLAGPLAKVFPDEPGPSRLDFVGSTCVIRTGRVDTHFGQAEVTARDGSTAVVQVRQTGTDALPSGSTGLLYAYDEAGEFFWVAPFDAALDPGPRADRG
ncbi:hypothetical protein [Streptomyces halobius]|uniref:DUF1449 family protein n=1 Tax=Streptomyces halobius TaxID=2879846 RepID=A0ABY4M425_9ACTN|nr:hypothetical protein [Streptomyces halobius]UQA92438.1 hypothetical protein K9S39_11855 [Streptomyces halobius]